MSNFTISYRPPKGETSIPQLTYQPATEEVNALKWLALADIPEPSRRGLLTIRLEPHTHDDPRLRAYRLDLLVSDPLPDDPPDWPQLIYDGCAPPQIWRLWRLWVRYGELPLVGELRYEREVIGLGALYHEAEPIGWRQHIYEPPWITGGAPPEIFFKVAQGLAYAQQMIQRPGHPEGTNLMFESRERFVQELREAKAIVGGHHRRVTKRRVSQQMGMAPSTLDVYLTRFSVVWEDA